MSRSIDGFKKTERTHEENQERAYIAASRRSDRSLEARLESARRASEIHKRRTGKALRVTEADVQNEEMYEEEDDLPASFAFGLGSSSFELRYRMQAYWEQQFALRNAMSLAAAGNNLNNPNLAVPQAPLSLQDYYRRFAQQYPLSMTTNQYFQPPLLPVHIQQDTMLHNNTIMTPSSPSMKSQSSSSPPTKSPVVSSRHSSISAPYSANNSHRNRRASEVARSPEQPSIQQRRNNSNAVTPLVKKETFQSAPVDMYTAQPMNTLYPFTTQLPNHMQQFNLADFSVPIEPTQPIQPVANKLADNINMDLFNNNEWSDLLTRSEPTKLLTPYDDGTNWDDYLDSEANWLFSSQQEPES